jgi:hypothetical protein
VAYVLALQSPVLLLISLGLFVLKAWAFVDALTRRAEAFPAADKLTKGGWLIILGIALAAQMLIGSPGSILNLAGAVAAIVYLVDARPALREVTRR